MKAFYLCATNFGVMSYKLTTVNMLLTRRIHAREKSLGVKLYQ